MRRGKWPCIPLQVMVLGKEGRVRCSRVGKDVGIWACLQSDIVRMLSLITFGS